MFIELPGLLGLKEGYRIFWIFDDDEYIYFDDGQGNIFQIKENKSVHKVFVPCFLRTAPDLAERKKYFVDLAAFLAVFDGLKVSKAKEHNNAIYVELRKIKK
jgi:hypothetical protein